MLPRAVCAALSRGTKTKRRSAGRLATTAGTAPPKPRGERNVRLVSAVSPARLGSHSGSSAAPLLPRPPCHVGFRHRVL